MALTTKALRKQCIMVSAYPEKFIQDKLDISSLEAKIDHNEVSLSQWKRVEIEEKGKLKHVMRIVQNTLTKDTKHIKDQSEDFESHVNRVKTHNTVKSAH